MGLFKNIVNIAESVWTKDKYFIVTYICQLHKCVAVQSPTQPLLDNEPPPSCVGGEGATDVSTRGHHSAESNDWRSVSKRRGRRERNLFSLQQLAG